MPIPAAPLRIGDSGSAAAALHRTLESINRRVDQGERDNRTFGPDTENVLGDLQKAAALPVTGVFDEATRESIVRILSDIAPFAVYGTVVDANGDPMVNVDIIVEDADLRRREMMGQTRTDSQGEYEVRYSRSKFTRAEKGSADLVVSVSIEGIGSIAESDIMFNAPDETRVDLTSRDRQGSCEYETLRLAIDPLLDGTPVTELLDTDLPFLQGETGLSAELWQAFISAQRLPMQAKGIPAAAFYAWMRAGLSSDWEVLRTTRITDLRARLGEAISRNLIPGWNGEQVDQIINQFPNSQYQEVGALVVATLPPEIAYKFAGSVDMLDDVSDQMLTSLVDAKAVEPADAELLGLSVSLHRLSAAQPEIIAKILQAEIPSVGDGKLQRARDLAALRPDDWERTLEAVGAPLPDGATRSTQARQLAIGVAAAFPEDSFRRQVKSAPRGLEAAVSRIHQLSGTTPDVLARDFDSLDVSHLPVDELDQIRAAHGTLRQLANVHPGLQLQEVIAAEQPADAAAAVAERIAWVDTVFDRNPDIEFSKLDFLPGGTDLARVDFGDLSDDARQKTVADLKAHQRIHSVTGNAVPAVELMQAGFDSAAAIATLPVEEFARITGLPAREAAAYHATAVERATAAAVTWFSVYEHARDRATTPVRAIPTRDQFFHSLEGYAKLVNDQPWCACEKCQSVLSPAAYFVDLMYFIERNIVRGSFTGRESHPLNLEKRRPDLWDLELTCANTTNFVPTLDLVNEIVERYLRDVVPFADNAALYRHLAATEASFEEPFTLPLARLQILLEHFGVSRHEIATAMQAAPTTHSRARLDLSLKEYGLITTERMADALFLLKLFRISSPVTTPDAVIGQQDMAALVKATGLPHDDLEPVLRSRFVGTDGSAVAAIDIVLGKRNPNDVQNNSEVVRNLTLRRLDRVHRFARLWRAVPWTVDELDYALGRLSSANPIPTIAAGVGAAKATIESIVDLLDANTSWSLPLDELLALSDAFPSRGLRSATSLFDRLFNQPAFVAPDGAWDDHTSIRFTHPSWTKQLVAGQPAAPVGHSIPADNTLLRCLAGLQLTDAEFVSLVAGLTLLDQIDHQPATQANDESIVLTHASLGALYRHARVRALLKCTVTEFLQILRLAPIPSRGADPSGFIRSLADLQSVVDFHAWRKSSGFSLDEIEYLVNPTREGVLDLQSITDDIVAGTVAERSLEFADTLFTQLGLTEAESRELVAANTSAVVADDLPFEPSTTGYRVRAIGTAGLVIPASLATQTDVAAVLVLLDAFLPLHVVDVALSRALQRSRDEVTLLRGLAEPPAQLDSAAIARALQGGTAGGDIDRVVQLVSRVSRLHSLFRVANFHLADLAFVASKPEIFFGATTPAPLVSTPAITLDVVRNVVRYAALASATDVGFSTASNPADIDAIHRVVTDLAAASYADLASALRTDEATIGALRSHVSLPTDTFGALDVLRRCIDLTKKLGVNAETFTRMLDESTPDASFDGLTRAAEDLFGAFRARYPDERVFAEKIEAFDDKQRSRKRDGLVDYLITRWPETFADADKLSEYLLTDVMVQGCARTSRVVAATSSLQLYVYRVLMNLERSADWDPMDATKKGVRAAFMDSAKRGEWQWRQHYRVWEANRRVFLYPENYLEPELRDDKTQLFEEFEDTLLLQEIDKASVHDAYSRYLTGFDEIARLKIAGTYYDQGTRRLHLFGVTQDDVPAYYYREVDESADSANGSLAPRFSAWQKLTLQIPVRSVSPIVFESRLYLFWVETSTRPVNAFKDGTSAFAGYRHTVRVRYSMLRPDGVWSSPQAVRFAEGGGTAESRIVEDPLDDAKLRALVAQRDAANALLSKRQTEADDAKVKADKALKPTQDATAARVHAQGIVEGPPTDGEIAAAWAALFFTGTPFEVTIGLLRAGEYTAYQITKINEANLIEAWRILNDAWITANETVLALKGSIASLQRAIDQQVTMVRWDSSKRNHRDALDNYKPEGWEWDRVYPDVYYAGSPELRLRLTLSPKGDRKPYPDTLPDPDDFDVVAGVLVELSPPAAPAPPGGSKLTLNWSSGKLQALSLGGYGYRGQEFFSAAACLTRPDLIGSGVAVGPTTSDVQIVNGLSASAIVEFAGDAVWMRPIGSGTYLGTRLGTSLTRTLSQQFWHDGADTLLDASFQQLLVEARSKISPIAGQSQPARQSPFHQDNACLTYFRETFFHVPFLVANHLNSQEKFSDTQRWYHYIFDPTAETGDPWRYREFREPSMLDTTLRQLLTDDKALAAYRAKPFSPHAIARTRMTAYQKAIVMKYIDNLLDWGDSLFNQFTMESVNEATMLYMIAQDILGPRPTVLGSCGEGKVSPKTYRTIRPGLSDVSDFLVELEAPPAVYAVQHTGPLTKYVVSVSTPELNFASFAATDNRAPAALAMPALAGAAPVPSPMVVVGNGPVASPLAARENRGAGATIWTSKGGTPLATTRNGSSADLSVRTLGTEINGAPLPVTDGGAVLPTTTKPKFGGAPVGVPGGQSIVPFGELDLHQLDVKYDLHDVDQINNVAILDQFRPIEYVPTEMVPPKDPVFCILPNDDLLAYWSRVEERLFKVRNCMDITGVRRQLDLFSPELDPRLLVRMTAAGLSIDDVLNSTSGNMPPYRFSYLIEKAKQYAATVQSFGAQLLGALEKGDAEELNQLRAVHEQNLLKIRTKVAQLEIDAAEDAIEGLNRQRTAVEYRQEHFTALREVGQIAGERKQQELQGEASNFRTAAGIAQVVASILTIIPDMGAPTAMKFGGSQLGAAGRAVAEGMNAVAAFNEMGASRAGVEAGNQRRDQEWQHQVQTARLELDQIDKNIAAAMIRRDIAVSSLTVHERTIAQSEEMFDFLREKFSSVDRYRLLSKDLRRLYRLAFNSALSIAKIAEQAYRAERPSDDAALSGDYWDAQNAGLLAGERLMIDLQQLEGQFIESNYRELEVEHSFSMAQFAPDALADLRLTGACDFEVPEWFFDLTYPGQYRRRLKAVRVSIPCVTGPYANIGATLRMTHSEIRLSAPLVGQPLAPVSTVPLRHTVSIATSKGQNDAGVFDFSFRDERYMPFEGAGAISGWSLSMPKTLRLFDYATISDVILHLDYTAQYDEGLKDRWDGAAHELLNLLSAEDESLLTRTFSLRNEFPDTFHRLVASPAGTEVTLTLESKHFPSFVTGNERKVAATAASLRIITALPGLDATAMAIGRKVDAPPQLFKEVTAPATPDVDGGELREYDLGDVFKSPLDEGGVPSDVVGPYVLKLATDSDPLGIYDIVLSIEYRLTGTTF